MIVRELLVKLGVIADPKKAQDFDKAIGDLKEHMESLVGVAKTVAAVVGTVGTAMGLQAIATANSALEIERQAAALSLSTDAYQEMRGALEAFGAEGKDLTDAFTQIAIRVEEARQGGEDAAKTFKLLGLQASSLKGLKPEEVFYKIADGMKNAKSSSDRLRAADALLGGDLARNLLPLLIQGAAGLDSFRAQARASGAVLDKDAIAKGKQAAAVYHAFMVAVKGLRNEVGLAFLPIMQRVGSELQTFMDTNRVEIGRLVEELSDALMKALDDVKRWAAKMDKFVEDHLGGWTNLFERAKFALAALAAGVGWRTLVLAVQAVSAAMVELTGGAAGLLAGAGLGTILGWAVALAAALVALYLVLDDLWTYWRGGESVIGNFIAGSERTRVTLAALGEAGRALGAVLSATWDAIRVGIIVLGPLFEVLSELLSGPAEGLLKMFGNQLLASIRAFARTMEFAASAIQTVVTALSYLWAMMEGRANLGDALSAVGSDAGKTIGALGRAVGQGALALPFLGSMTGGGKSASGGGVYVPATAPTTVPTSAPAPSVTTTNSVAGNTNYFYGLSTRDIEEMQYREGLTQSRQLLALSGAGT